MSNNLSNSLWNETIGLSSYLAWVNTFKNKILDKNLIEESFIFSYVKNFNDTKAIIKKKGKIKKKNNIHFLEIY